MHLLNLVWPNIFEISPHVVQAVTGAINGCRLALGPAVILSYLLQGLWHPARSVLQPASKCVAVMAGKQHSQGSRPGCLVILESSPDTLAAHSAHTGTAVILLCCRKVREVYWRLFNELYVAVSCSFATLYSHCCLPCSADLCLISASTFRCDSSCNLPCIDPACCVLQSADALTAFWPPMEDDNINTYRRQELDIFL